MQPPGVPFTRLPVGLDPYYSCDGSGTLRRFLHFAPISSDRIPVCGRAMRADKQAKRFLVSGRVQGVGYRYFAMSAAEQLDIAGYARNLLDGRVEVYAIGTAPQLRDFARELQRGPRFAAVDRIDEAEAEIVAAWSSAFSVNYE